MRRFLRWLWGCEHEWHNTGAFYSNGVIIIVLKQCRNCGETCIVEVQGITRRR